jgi:hypothetical protein
MLKKVKFDYFKRFEASAGDALRNFCLFIII